ncbi:MAG: amidohydrolase [Parvicellaceae bacterium]|jgi:amidohydrolase
MMPKKLVSYRKYLHAHPELSGYEFKTSAYIREVLAACSSAQFYEVAKTGLLVQFKGENPENHVLLRCELDALPIHEAPGKWTNYGSNSDGVSHKCGHDGHMAILMGVTEQLEKHPPNGTVSLLFQPAEETGIGSNLVVNDPVFNKVCKPTKVFALHNIPGRTMGEIIVKNGDFSSSVISAKVVLKGKASHAAAPENGENPIYMISKFIQTVKAMENRDVESEEFRLLTPIYVKAGSEDFGISASYGELGYTMRAKSHDQLDALKKTFEFYVLNSARSKGLTVNVSWLAEFRGVRNADQSVEIIKKAGLELGLTVFNKAIPYSWGEDFGVFTEKYSGAMFGVGAGISTPPLHDKNYDFPDEIIDTCVKLFMKIIQKAQ